MASLEGRKQAEPRPRVRHLWSEDPATIMAPLKAASQQKENDGQGSKKSERHGMLEIRAENEALKKQNKSLAQAVARHRQDLGQKEQQLRRTKRLLFSIQMDKKRLNDAATREASEEPPAQIEGPPPPPPPVTPSPPSKAALIEPTDSSQHRTKLGKVNPNVPPAERGCSTAKASRRPTRTAAAVASYKEPPLNVKMRNDKGQGPILFPRKSIGGS